MCVNWVVGGFVGRWLIEEWFKLKERIFLPLRRRKRDGVESSWGK